MNKIEVGVGSRKAHKRSVGVHGEVGGWNVDERSSKVGAQI
jgi:hypothetical protein